MTRERYFKMCEQLGQEPNLEEIPPDIEDFPEIAVQDGADTRGGVGGGAR